MVGVQEAQAYNQWSGRMVEPPRGGEGEDLILWQAPDKDAVFQVSKGQAGAESSVGPPVGAQACALDQARYVDAVS